MRAAPDVKAAFGVESVPMGRLKYDPRFRRHAALITRHLDFAIKNLGHDHKLAHHFDQLGAKHIAMEGRGFRPHYWSVFAALCIEHALEPDERRNRRPAMDEAWKSLVSQRDDCPTSDNKSFIQITYLIYHMRVGFERERAARDRYVAALASSSSPHATLVVERASSLEERRRDARRSPSPLLGALRPTLLRSSSCVETPATGEPPSSSRSSRADYLAVDFDRRLELVRRRMSRRVSKSQTLMAKIMKLQNTTRDDSPPSSDYMTPPTTATARRPPPPIFG